MSTPDYENELKTAKAVIDHIKKNNTYITYKELSEIVPVPRGPQGFNYILGDIQEYCKAVDVPCLPVMVVNSGTKKPGEGFEEAYRDTYKSKKALSIDEIICIEARSCLGWDDWSPLIDYISDLSNA